MHGNKKFNKYDLSGSYGIGYTSKGEKFYFDLEDYGIIKFHCWYIETGGRLCARNAKGGTPLKFHRLVMNSPLLPMEVDHINRKQYDNRKSNLRVCSHAENLHNVKVHTTNTSGITGVSFRKDTQKYTSRIEYNKQVIHLGCFVKMKDAIIARLQAEKKYFGKFASQRHLFEEYNIK